MTARRARGQRRPRFRRLDKVLDIVDTIESVAYGLLALALLCVILFLGVRAAHRLAGPAASGAAIALCAAAVGTVVRDVVRRRWSRVSVAAAVAYAACFLAVIAAEIVLEQ